ncbi:MAG: F0F1 ATP synthase subunit gamma [Fuerstiella sp.]
MQTLETLKRSIKIADDLAGVVRTMKTMAAVSIRQYETATESLDVYSRTIETGLRMVLHGLPGGGRNSVASVYAGTSQTTVALGINAVTNPATDAPAVHVSSRTKLHDLKFDVNEQQNSTTGHVGAIIFGSDQGMCGQFNEQIAHFAVDSFAATENAALKFAPVLCVGHRVSDKLTGGGIDVKRIFRLPDSASGITSLVQDLLPAIDQWRQAHDIARILVFHNRRLSASTWRPYVMQLLPLVPERLTQHVHEDANTANRTLPMWTMDTSILFSRLVQQFLFVSLFRACAESLAGENASRIAAMQAAERNIRDRLQLLRSDYATRRQTTITEELLDVVTGFEALKHN